MQDELSQVSEKVNTWIGKWAVMNRQFVKENTETTNKHGKPLSISLANKKIEKKTARYLGFFLNWDTF